MAEVTDAYSQALDKAHKELTKANDERAVLDVRIVRLKQTIATLLRLLGTDEPASISNKGITDAVREYLAWVKARDNRAITIRELRDQLESVGFDFSNYKNPNASIGGTLERLCEAKEVKRMRRRRDDGVTVTGYRWLGPVMIRDDKGNLLLPAKEDATEK